MTSWPSSGISGNPYDERDPFIFHSLSISDIDMARRLILNDAALAPFNMTHSLDDYSDVEVAELSKRWESAGIGSRGHIYEIDWKAGDGAYVFTTPGYVFDNEKVTFAFRFSSLLTRGNTLFRCNDIQQAYQIAELNLNNKLRSDDEADFAYEDFESDLSDIVEAGTLSSDESKIIIPDFNRYIFEGPSAFSQTSVNIIKRKIESIPKRLSNEIKEKIRDMWEYYLKNRFSLRRPQFRVKGHPETLFDGILPLRAAEFILIPGVAWRPMTEFTPSQLSGLGRMFVKHNRRLLIPASRQR